MSGRRQTYVLNERSLVLEGVTLAGVVQLVVQVLVDLARGAVLDEEAAEDTEAAHPEDLLGHTGIGGTLALTEATVAAVTAGQVELTSTGSRVHGNGLADDQAILDQLADGLAGVGVGDLADLVGVEPDLVLAAADDRGGQALLGTQVDPVEERIKGQQPCFLSHLALITLDGALMGVADGGDGLMKNLPNGNRAIDDDSSDVNKNKNFLIFWLCSNIDTSATNPSRELEVTSSMTYPQAEKSSLHNNFFPVSDRVLSLSLALAGEYVSEVAHWHRKKNRGTSVSVGRR
jgi:hypothetical protein